MDNVETTIVTLTVGDNTNTTHVATAGDHGQGTSVELDKVGDLASGKVDLDGVVDLDQGVGVADAIEEWLVSLKNIQLTSTSGVNVLDRSHSWGERTETWQDMSKMNV